MRIFTMTAACVAALLAGCEDRENPSEATACEGDGVVISDAWARAAHAGQPTSAAYFTICNGGQSDDALVAVSMAGVRAAEIHVTTVSEEGTASMAPADEIALPAGRSVSLEPGAAHVMLIGVERAMSPNNAPTIRLEFKNAPPQEITLDVRELTDAHH